MMDNAGVITPPDESIPGKWRTLLLLALAELLAMGVWFSASAVIPALTTAWTLDDSGQAWLTMSVQIGFVVGAFASALLTLADRIPARRLFALLWGFAVGADSAQFSTCVTELCDAQFTGTALTLQTSMGFLLTLLTIRLLPVIQGAVGWGWAFAFLALGPAAGIWAMWTLRRSEAASRLAGGRG